MYEIQDRLNRRQRQNNPFGVHKNQTVRKGENVEVALERLRVRREGSFILDIIKKKAVVIIDGIIDQVDGRVTGL